MSKRKPTEPPKDAPAPKRTRRKRSRVEELLDLDPVAFRRAVLLGALEDLERARAKGSHTAVMALTGQVVRLRTEISQAEERDRAALLAARSTEELVGDLVELIGKLPEGVFERVVAAVEQRRTGRARVRLVPA